MSSTGCRASLVPFALLALLAAGRAGAAGGSIGDEDFEVSGFAGFRTNGSLATRGGDLAGLDEGLSYGGALDLNLHRGNFKLVALYSHAATTVGVDRFFPESRVDLSVDYLHAGIAQEAGNERARFYVSALLGATLLRPSGFDAATQFSFSLGAGLKRYVGRRTGLRVDARAFGTPAGTGASAVCRSGTCLLTFSGSIFWQWDFAGGLVLAF